MRRVLILGVLAVVGCQLPAGLPTTSTAPSKPDDYTTWPTVTTEPYQVDRPVAMMCAAAAPPQGQQEALARVHGPHAVHAINVRVSPTGRDEFLARNPVPVGTVVVKEKLTGNGPPVAVATMTKKEPGYDPDNGDWEYAYRELKTDAPPPTVGRIESCIACHRTTAGKDFLFRPYLNRLPR